MIQDKTIPNVWVAVSDLVNSIRKLFVEHKKSKRTTLPPFPLFRLLVYLVYTPLPLVQVVSVPGICSSRDMILAPLKASSVS